MRHPVWIGVDVGTSGCRAVAIDSDARVVASARVPLPDPIQPADGWSEQDPHIWWDALLECLSRLGSGLGPEMTRRALAVDATSGTLLLATPDGSPCGPALMYKDRRATAEASLVDAAAPPDSPARGAGSSLSKLLYLAERAGTTPGLLALHQADWLIGRLTGRYGLSDWNNALKLGYDARAPGWPGWVLGLVPRRIRLPRVIAPGALAGGMAPAVAHAIAWHGGSEVRVGTTDSTAAVIAAGAAASGEAVTCLGSTLVLKVVSNRPVESSADGVYSHRLGEVWLVGGASNSGGGVLRRYFTDDELVALSRSIDPDRPSGLDYYPLPGRGERFPTNDPDLLPRLTPRPNDPRRFLHGLLEGIARIEAAGYARLAELGAPRPTRIMTLGGGASNPAWTRIRERALGIPVTAAEHPDAAYGTALLALRGTARRPEP